jgi:dipeptidyl aminopeptidase/acylaminoacyl peptidase
MSPLEYSPTLAASLERLVPRDETVTVDWADVLGRLDSGVKPMRRGARSKPRRLRLLAVAAAALLVLAAIATATYYALHRSAAPKSVLTILSDDEVVARGPGARIAVVEPGGRLRTLWHCPRPRFCGNLKSLAWSPDGRHLAFTMSNNAALSVFEGLHILDIDTGRHRMIPGKATLEAGLRPLGCVAFSLADLSWSPDGRRLAYTCPLPGSSGRSAIFIVHADGSHRVALVTGTRRALSPTWSPDGTRIAFATGRAPTGVRRERLALDTLRHSSVYVVALDGTGRKLVVAGGAAPAWSPDGRTIAYEARCGVALAPVTAGVKMRGSGCSAIGPRGVPAWSLDGRTLAIGTRGGVYVLRANGTHLRRVTHESGAGWFFTGRPAWAPEKAVSRLRPTPRVPAACGASC